MSAFQIFTQPSQQALDTAANVLSGATLTFSLTGTSTPTNAYSDSTLSTPVANPLSANAAGVFIPVFLDPTITYRIVLKTQAGAVLQTWDPANENIIGYFTQSLIGSILYPRTAAEIAASVTPVNYAFPPGSFPRYGGLPAASAATNNAALTAMLAVSASHRASIPAGNYTVTAAQVIPAFATVSCDANAYFYYTDSVSTGAYLFTVGASGSGPFYNVAIDRLRIVLQTVTAKGLNLINVINSQFDDIYCEGLVVSAGAMSARTNVGVRIEATAGQNSFFNRFGNLYLNHIHTGLLIPDSGGFVGQQEIRYLNTFGDANIGDEGARGVDAVAGQDIIIHGGYVESYFNAGGAAGMRLATGKCVRWKVSKVVFDLGGSLSGAMFGIVLAGSGTPKSNQFLQCYIDPTTTSVVDGTTAVDGNLIENNPNIAATFTATLVPQTSGTITLTSGVGGDQCFCIRRGNEVHVWGALHVSSVSAPVGSLFLSGLPFTIANNNSNFMPVAIWMNGANATATTMMQGYALRASTSIEINHFAAGTSASAAADIKAGTDIFFDVTYATIAGT